MTFLFQLSLLWFLWKKQRQKVSWHGNTGCFLSEAQLARLNLFRKKVNLSTLNLFFLRTSMKTVTPCKNFSAIGFFEND